ncbi:MAG: hypothetical protein Q8P67_14680 [archaeon]|nr:hypothetical protein [archaeon]
MELPLRLPPIPQGSASLGLFIEAVEILALELLSPASRSFEGRFRLVEGGRYIGSITLSPSDLKQEASGGDPSMGSTWVVRVSPLASLPGKAVPLTITPILKQIEQLPPSTPARGCVLYSMMDFFMLECPSSGTLRIDVSVLNTPLAKASFDDTDPALSQLYIRHGECPPAHKFPLLHLIDYDHLVQVQRSSSGSSPSPTEVSTPLLCETHSEISVQSGLYYLSVFGSNCFQIDYTLSYCFSSLAQASSGVRQLSPAVLTHISPSEEWSFSKTVIPHDDLTVLFMVIGPEHMPSHAFQVFAQHEGLPCGAETEHRGAHVQHPLNPLQLITFITLSPRELKSSGVGPWYLGIQYPGFEPLKGSSSQQFICGFFLFDSCNPLAPIARSPALPAPLSWGTVPLRRWTYYDIVLETQHLGQHLLIEYVCSQTLTLKVKKGSIPSPFQSEQPDIREIDGPMSKVTPWWRGALLIKSSYLHLQGPGKWYVGFEGVPRNHALIGIRASLIDDAEILDTIGFEESMLSPELRIID